MKFNTIGIICEYNPFHFGHLYHINETKKITKCKNLVCVMSGSMVQRGESAIFDKWTRAKAAIEAGANLVIELPAYYVLQSAEIFAYGAVKLLNDIKIVDGISFGSESGDISILKKVGSFIANPSSQYRDKLNERLKLGDSYPKASEYALNCCMKLDDKNFFSPNNILAMCYISAAEKLGSNLDFVTVKRNNDYHGSDSADEFLSATAIRDLINKGLDYSKYAPDYSAYTRFDLQNSETYILGFLRNIPADVLSRAKGHESGLANLVKSSARKASTLDELFEMCVSKRYTLHRIKRFIACAILGINEALEPDYVRILGFNENGASLIKQLKEKSHLIPITKTANYHGSKMFDIDVAATDFSYLCSDSRHNRRCGADFLNSPFVLKNYKNDKSETDFVIDI